MMMTIMTRTKSTAAQLGAGAVVELKAPANYQITTAAGYSVIASPLLNGDRAGSRYAGRRWV